MSLLSIHFFQISSLTAPKHWWCMHSQSASKLCQMLDYKILDCISFTAVKSSYLSTLLETGRFNATNDFFCHFHLKLNEAQRIFFICIGAASTQFYWMTFTFPYSRNNYNISKVVINKANTLSSQQGVGPCCSIVYLNIRWRGWILKNVLSSHLKRLSKQTHMRELLCALTRSINNWQSTMRWMRLQHQINCHSNLNDEHQVLSHHRLFSVIIITSLKLLKHCLLIEIKLK